MSQEAPMQPASEYMAAQANYGNPTKHKMLAKSNIGAVLHLYHFFPEQKTQNCVLKMP